VATADKIAGKVARKKKKNKVNISDSILSKMSDSQLEDIRHQFPNDPAMQSVLAPYEHRAYARERVANNPAMAAFFTLAIPAYSAAKASGLIKSDSPYASPASLAEMAHGYRGMWEGLSQFLTDQEKAMKKGR